jgi:ADP-ribosylation factor-like protein 8
LGGLPRFRSIWSRYCTGMDAIIFMLDAQNQTQFEQSKWELEQLMSSTRLEGIPLLVLANKMDNDEGNAPTIGMQELAEQLDFVKIGNERAVGCIPISCKEGRNIGE